MKYKILQLNADNPNVLKDHKLFESWNMLNRTSGFSKNDYKAIYEGEVEFDTSIRRTLDNIFRKFNIFRPSDFKGHSLSTSDVVVLNDQMYYCDSIGWVDVDTEEIL